MLNLNSIKVIPTTAALRCGAAVLSAVLASSVLAPATAARTLGEFTVYLAGPNISGSTDIRAGREDEGIAKTLRAMEKGLAGKYLTAALNNLCMSYVVKQEFDRAAPYCEKALERNPNDWKFHNNLAVARLGQGDVDSSIAHMREARDKEWKTAEAVKVNALKRPYEKVLALHGEIEHDCVGLPE